MNREHLYTIAREELSEATKNSSIKADAVKPMKRVVDRVLAALPPAGFMACAELEDGTFFPLVEYTASTVGGVAALVQAQARKEGYKGATEARLVELGWVILPIHLWPPGQT